MKYITFRTCYYSFMGSLGPAVLVHLSMCESYVECAVACLLLCWFGFSTDSAACLRHRDSAPLFDLLPFSPMLPSPHSHAKVSGRVYLIINRWVFARLLWHPPSSLFTSEPPLPATAEKHPFPMVTCPCYSVFLQWWLTDDSHLKRF